MGYVYHRVPDEIRGNVLYPLNVLRKKFPDLYERKVLKYEGRMLVLKRKIPVFNCLWNDVLHLTPVHPSQVYDALKEAGYGPRPSKWYKIDTSSLDSDKLLLYLYKNEKGDLSEDEVKLFDEKELPNYLTLPEKTKEYYKEEFKKGIRPLMFHWVPHVLCKNELNIDDFKIIDV